MPPTLADGFWGKSTSTLEWCERNYEVTFYIAEFWNTLSNLVMIVPPLWSAFVSWREQLEFRFVSCHLLLALVGIGSWCFHMTLRYEMQLLDELPMIYVCCALVYAMEGSLKPPKSQNKILLASLIAYSVMVTLAYLVVKVPLFHQVMYGLLAVYTILVGIKLSSSPHFNKALYYGSVSFYIFGFLLWNLDNIFCSQLTHLRSTLPTSLRPATQLHAWWHLFTGYPAYLYILVCCQTRLNFLKTDYDFKYGLVGVWISKQTKLQQS